MIRRFELHRDEDVSGISGTGVVAEGAILSSGKAVIEWLTEWPTSVVWHDRGLESVEHVHGHSGRTRIVWVDGDPRGEPVDVDRLHLDLKGSRERLCRSQVNVPDHWRSDLGDALRIVDLVGSSVCPQQWVQVRPARVARCGRRAHMTALTLDAEGWYAAQLAHSVEAVAWLDSLGQNVVRLEVLEEGVLAVYTGPAGWPNTSPSPVLLCPCGQGESFIEVRRRYAGPVPRQVLAAFKPAGQTP